MHVSVVPVTFCRKLTRLADCNKCTTAKIKWCGCVKITRKAWLESIARKAWLSDHVELDLSRNSFSTDFAYCDFLKELIYILRHA